MSAITLPPAMSAFNGAREAPRALVEQIIEELVATLDAADGDPDLEDGGDDEPTGDELDTGWPEWSSRSQKVTAGGYEIHSTYGTEDDEDGDPSEEDDAAEEDDHSGGDNAEDDFHLHHTAYRCAEGAGCPISDPGGCQHDGREEEAC